MKAARLHQVGSPLVVETISDPVLLKGGAIVKVLAAFLPSFTAQVLSGELNYMLPPLPFTPGSSVIGIVETVAEDVFNLNKGQLVFCDYYVRSPDKILIGWTGLTPTAAQTQSLWKDGAMAEYALFPAENLTPLTGVEAITPTQLVTLTYLAIPYGGLLRGNLRPSQTIIINGATGNLGAGAVLVALAMGAAKVVAVGRDTKTLEKLVQLNPERVVSVALHGDASEYGKQIQQAAGEVDMVLDVLGGVKNPDPTIACINALRPRGTAVFMGGVQSDIPLPYAQIMLKEITIQGAFMFPQQAPYELIRMVAAGTLNLDVIQTHVFNLDDINTGVAKASELKGLDYCVLAP